jgi:hypothetical protein
MKKQLTVEDRKAISLVKMEMVKMAGVNIKNIFPSLGANSPKVHQTKNGSYTKKGSGRKHLQGNKS